MLRVVIRSAQRMCRAVRPETVPRERQRELVVFQVPDHGHTGDGQLQHCTSDPQCCMYTKPLPGQPKPGVMTTHAPPSGTAASTPESE